jgi:hypothetical protein
MELNAETPLLHLQLILSGISEIGCLESSASLCNLPPDNLTRMDSDFCALESFITHTRNGLLRSPSDTPKDDDVLLGRGKCYQFRKGNVRFRGKKCLPFDSLQFRNSNPFPIHFLIFRSD